MKAKAKLMNVTCSLRMGLVVASAIFLHHNATATPTMVDLGSAWSFAVLAGAGITVAGPINSTTITGDIGSYPTPSITGLGNVVLNGANHAGDGVTENAKGINGLLAAYNDAAGRTPDNATPYVGDYNLALLSPLSPGVYHGGSSLSLTGTLTLDAGGDPNAVWIFQMGSTLTTADGIGASKVDLINDAQACHVFWQVGSSATIGTYSDFVGNILALEDITLYTGATVDGRVLAGANQTSGAVALDNNTIIKSVCNGTAVPDTGSTLLLLGSVLATLLGFRRRFFSLA
jgi:hypothetical protein